MRFLYEKNGLINYIQTMSLIIEAGNGRFIDTTHTLTHTHTHKHTYTHTHPFTHTNTHTHTHTPTHT